MIRINVVLPAPLGPNKPNIPVCISMETEFNALNGFFFTPINGALEARRKIVFFNIRNRPSIKSILMFSLLILLDK